MTMTEQQKASRGPEAIASIDTAFGQDRRHDIVCPLFGCWMLRVRVKALRKCA